MSRGLCLQSETAALAAVFVFGNMRDGFCKLLLHSEIALTGDHYTLGLGRACTVHGFRKSFSEGAVTRPRRMQRNGMIAISGLRVFDGLYSLLYKQCFFIEGAMLFQRFST